MPSITEGQQSISKGAEAYAANMEKYYESSERTSKLQGVEVGIEPTPGFFIPTHS